MSLCSRAVLLVIKVLLRYNSKRKITPLGLSGGCHVSWIEREERTVVMGDGCSDGAKINKKKNEQTMFL